MLDRDVVWRTHRWTFDCEFTERADAPILAALITMYGSMVDETWAYIFQGKAKQYITRFKHYGGTRWNPRIGMEKRDRKGTQLKLSEFIPRRQRARK